MKYQLDFTLIRLSEYFLNHIPLSLKLPKDEIGHTWIFQIIGQLSHTQELGSSVECALFGLDPICV